MYKHTLIHEDQVFELAMAHPKKASVIAKTALRAGGSGRLAVTVTAADNAVSLKSGKKLIVSYVESETEKGVFDTPKIAPTTVVEMDSSVAFKKNDVIARLLLPENCGKWLKAKIATTDEAAAGTLNVFLEYLAG